MALIALALMQPGCADSGRALSPAPGGSLAGQPLTSHNGAKGAGLAMIPGNGAGGGDGMQLDGDPGDPGSGLSPLEYEEWDVVSFTDPRDSSIYDVIDGRVIIAFTNPPEIPIMPSNYFEQSLPSDDLYYQELTYPSTWTTDPDVAAFLAAENLTVFSEWADIKCMACTLPEGQTVADAVANWPTEYHGLVECVDPDSVVYTSTGLNPYPPNDDLYDYQWAIEQSDSYDVKIDQFWQQDPGYAGSTSIVVAILDTGVDWDVLDLRSNSTAFGCNTGDDTSSTTFTLRTNGGGEPWAWIQNIGPACAAAVGHGTQMAGIISAAVNNDPGEEDVLNDGKDVAGVAINPRYFPIAIKHRAGFSSTGTINAYKALGCVAGILTASKEFWPGIQIPHYNIKVVNCSYGNYQSTHAGVRKLDQLSPYMLFVGSAGNDNKLTKIMFPARYPAALAVTGYDNAGNRATWTDGGRLKGSNFSSDVDIAAPGKMIITTDMFGYNIHGDRLGDFDGTWASIDGTSAACAYVSAAAALAYPRTPLPTYYAPTAVANRLVSTALPLADLDGTLGDVEHVNIWGATR